MVGSGLLTGFLLHIVVRRYMLLLFLPIPISPEVWGYRYQVEK